jgi:hypothetical protein
MWCGSPRRRSPTSARTEPWHWRLGRCHRHAWARLLLPRSSSEDPSAPADDPGLLTAPQASLLTSPSCGSVRRSSAIWSGSGSDRRCCATYEVFRCYDHATMTGDLIAEASERHAGRSLLEPFVDFGELIRREPYRRSASGRWQTSLRCRLGCVPRARPDCAISGHLLRAAIASVPVTRGDPRRGSGGA